MLNIFLGLPPHSLTKPSLSTFCHVPFAPQTGHERAAARGVPAAQAGIYASRPHAGQPFPFSTCLGLYPTFTKPSASSFCHVLSAMQAMSLRLHVVYLLPQMSHMDDMPVDAQDKVMAANMHGADAEPLRAARRKFFPNGELDDGGGAIPPMAAGTGLQVLGASQASWCA